MSSTLLRLKALVVVLTAVLVIGTAGFTVLEGQPVLEAFYSSVVTMVTVGYGDIHPVTPAGKFLSIVLILTGVCTFLCVVANGTELLMMRRQERLRKRLNMIIGLFFSEAGNRLLTVCVKADTNVADFGNELHTEQEWTDADYAWARELVYKSTLVVGPSAISFGELNNFIREKANLVLRILEHPNLVEHDLFTDLLRAIFHMKDELLNRKGFEDLPQTDLDHMAGDLNRAYKPLVIQWLHQMQYLRAHYPYLFALGARINPFKENPDPVVR